MPANIFNPGQVTLGQTPLSRAPYTKGIAMPKPEQPSQPSQSTVLRPEAVRASGTGPFDPAYRQNLATYAGGGFSRPGGTFSFNPTAQLGQPGSLNAGGQPTGGGTSPVAGAPNDLLSLAIGGQPFSFTPPQVQPAASEPAAKNQTPLWQSPQWQQWLQRLTNQGGLLRGF